MPSSTAARSDPAAAVALAAYRALGFIARPIVPYLLSRRAARGKEVKARLGERLGRASAVRPAGRVVWVHAASVGETNAVLPLVERILACGLSVVFTTVTVTSAGIAAARLPEGAVHQFAPVDIAPVVGRFLSHWQPECALFVESELWPATIMKLAARHVPQVLLNARLSQKSFDGWKRFPRVARALIGRIGLCLAQTERDGERYAALGAGDVRVTGNLKFDVAPPPADPASVAAFREALAGRPVWVAASTHPGEEMEVAAAHRIARERHPRLLTIVVPRHPDRGGDIKATLAASGFSVAQRSAGEGPGEGTDIYLADTLGELGLFYRVAPVAFLGGSLVHHGGQNPIEPVRLDTVILHGPHVHNFEDIYAALDAGGGARAVDSAVSLGEVVASLLADPAAVNQAAAAAARALEPFSGALGRTMQALAPLLAAGQVAARAYA